MIRSRQNTISAKYDQFWRNTKNPGEIRSKFLNLDFDQCTQYSIKIDWIFKIFLRFQIALKNDWCHITTQLYLDRWLMTMTAAESWLIASFTIYPHEKVRVISKIFRFTGFWMSYIWDRELLRWKLTVHWDLLLRDMGVYIAEWYIYRLMKIKSWQRKGIIKNKTHNSPIEGPSFETEAAWLWETNCFKTKSHENMNIFIC